MPVIGSMTVELSAQHMLTVEVLEGSLFPRYASAKSFLGQHACQQCQQCLCRFYSLSWLIEINEAWYTVCSKKCADTIIHEHTMVQCDNCAYDVERHMAQHAIVHNTPVIVCSAVCLGRLQHVWQSTPRLTCWYRKVKRLLA